MKYSLFLMKISLGALGKNFKYLFYTGIPEKYDVFFNTFA
jgi:hypothetical protein